MTVDEAFVALGAAGDAPDMAAEEFIFDHWDEAAPAGCALLHRYVTGQDASEATERALYHVILLLAQHEEPAAFGDLCALLLETERADLILGDAIGDILPCILISCFDGDTAPLRRLMECRAAEELVRAAGLMAMAYLTQAKRVTQAEMMAYLGSLHEVFAAEESSLLWACWVDAVGLLGFRGLAGRVRGVLDGGRIKEAPPDLAQFNDMVQFAQDNPGSLDGFADIGIYPLSVEMELAKMAAEEDEEGPMAVPIINPLRHVGRNDPCPCGSGKKYKKCCLAA